MKAGILFSGGKDSNFSLYLAKEAGYDIACLISIEPARSDSMLFHYPNIWVTKLQAESMNIPILYHKARENEDESKLLMNLVSKASENFGIKVIVTGGVKSKYQRRSFIDSISPLGIQVFNPLWEVDESKYLYQMVSLGFKFIMTSVSAYGLGPDWLGKIFDVNMIDKLLFLSKKYGFNPSLEGGEGETLVLDAPNYTKELILENSDLYWDGTRGILKVKRVSLRDKIRV
ncbi:MAG: diphthine--ammonia ligase [Nitrososphaerota archaeon]